MMLLIPNNQNNLCSSFICFDFFFIVFPTVIKYSSWKLFFMKLENYPGRLKYEDQGRGLIKNDFHMV